MDVRVEPVGDSAVVVAPSGRLTMVTAGELTATVERTVAAGRTVVVVDLAETDFMDSSGLGALVTGLRVTRAAGGDLRIARATEQVLTVLQLTTMDRVLRPYDTVDEALGAG